MFTACFTGGAFDGMLGNRILIEKFNNRLSLLCEEDLQLKIIEDPFSTDRP